MRSRIESAETGSLDTLTLEELNTVCKEVGATREGAFERREVEAAIQRQLGVPQKANVIESLSTPCLKAILDVRTIPFDDCIEQQDLVQRVLATPRGSVFKLPAKVLKRMLCDYGCEGEVYVDKENLARRVMVLRSLHRGAPPRSRPKRAGASQSKPEQGSPDTCANARTGAGARQYCAGAGVAPPPAAPVRVFAGTPSWQAQEQATRQPSSDGRASQKCACALQ